jgi:ABC-type transport system involved in multi-copper enzyme maturation permease subunit
MLNALAAAWRLATYQTIGPRKRWVTIGIMMIPIVLALVTSMSNRTVNPDRVYGRIIAVLFGNVVLPFLAIFWGSSLIADEVEGKTLVYIATRPAGRIKVLLLKFIPMCFWLMACLLPTLAAVCTIIYWKSGPDEVLENLQRVVWDGRGFMLGGMAYAALGFFCAALVKKPLMAGIAYVFIIDSFVIFIPGFLKQLSLRFYIYHLGSVSQEHRPPRFFRFLSKEEPVTELHATLVLLGVTVLLLSLAAMILRQREFAGDDPARAT